MRFNICRLLPRDLETCQFETFVGPWWHTLSLVFESKQKKFQEQIYISYMNLCANFYCVLYD